MTIRDWAAVLDGMIRVARLRPDGISAFDATPQGFWRSFWAAAILAPLAATTMLFEAADLGSEAEPTRFLLLQAIAYVVNWVAFPLLMLRIADLLQRGHNYFRYMVAYNWFRLLQAAVVYPISLLALSQMVPDDAVAFLSLVVISAMLLYDWFIAKSALEIDGGTAAAIVIIGFLLGILVNGLALRLA